jgi:hypothetical protein
MRLDILSKVELRCRLSITDYRFLMLISKPHKFLFIHIYKNAGTSVRRAIYPYVATKWRWRVHNYLSKIGITALRPSGNPAGHEGHATARQVAESMGREKFRSYFSFAVVRNPWDWVVSLYTYMLKDSTHKQHELAEGFSGFDEYIRWRCREDYRYQNDWVCDEDGNLLVDFVARFEHLEEDFDEICRRIGVEAALPHSNPSSHAPYTEYYTPETIELVRETYRPDIEFFGYDFDKAPAKPIIKDGR